MPASTPANHCSRRMAHPAGMPLRPELAGPGPQACQPARLLIQQPGIRGRRHSPTRCRGVTAISAMMVEQLGLAMMPPCPYFMPSMACRRKQETFEVSGVGEGGKGCKCG